MCIVMRKKFPFICAKIHSFINVEVMLLVTDLRENQSPYILESTCLHQPL